MADRYILRTHRPGDLGWIVYRHGMLYHHERGWDDRYEGLVAEIAANFLNDFDQERERCWIAELDGENAGSVLIVKHPEKEGVAQLRLFLIEPRARGLGIGKRLVSECTSFARQAGYRRIMLWTVAGLDAARHIYEAEGYRLTAEEPFRAWGADHISQTFELAL